VTTGRRGGVAAARRRGERGAATAELAVALPSLVLVLALALGAVDLGLAQVRCVDAARLGARLLARGEAQPSALSAVRAAAPGGATVSVAGAGDRVRVSVAADLPAVLRPLRALSGPAAVAEARIEAAP
jgi:hypothetical protein